MAVTTRRARAASSQALLGAAPRLSRSRSFQTNLGLVVCQRQSHTRDHVKSRNARGGTCSAPIRTRRDVHRAGGSINKTCFDYVSRLLAVETPPLAQTRTPGGARLAAAGRPAAAKSRDHQYPAPTPTGNRRGAHTCSVHKDPRARDIRMHALTSTPKLSNINLAVERCAVERTILQALCPELLLISAHHALVDCPKRMDPTYARL